ncbi:DUF4279 domain-containing protein [Thermodesulfobacteriota bacterium]
MKDEFSTIRGFVEGEEPEEETYFAYSATLRIFGDIADPEEISNRLRLSPTRTHRKGEKAGPRSPSYRKDMWSYSPPMAESEPLAMHIDALWSKLKPHSQYLLALKQNLEVDVFLGYRTNCDHAGIEVPHGSLEMFTELQIPFGVSIVIA